jgi:hypothetical protein
VAPLTAPEVKRAAIPVAPSLKSLDVANRATPPASLPTKAEAPTRAAMAPAPPLTAAWIHTPGELK